LDRDIWIGVNWSTVGVIVVAGMVFWRKRTRDARFCASANAGEAMTLADAERIVQDYAAVLAEGATDGPAFYASRLPHSPERIVQAMKLWLAHDIKNRSLTEEFRNEIGTLASRLPFFIEDAKARRLNTAKRSFDEFLKKHPPAERVSLAREDFTARAKADGEVHEWAIIASTRGGMLRGELSQFIAAVELFAPAASSYWRRVYALAGLEYPAVEEPFRAP
jgi:hypothetical protein